jgi:hypothetical protein
MVISLFIVVVLFLVTDNCSHIPTCTLSITVQYCSFECTVLAITPGNLQRVLLTLRRQQGR